jgi:F-type H+-transporting ATPase subunit b
MVEDAKAEIESEKKAALAEVRNQVVTLSVEIAEKLIQETLKNDKAQKDLVNKYLKDKSFN